MKNGFKEVLIHEKAKIQEQGIVIAVMIPWIALEKANTTVPQLRAMLGQAVDLTIDPAQGEMFDNKKKPTQATNSPSKDTVTIKRVPGKRGRPKKTNSQPRV